MNRTAAGTCRRTSARHVNRLFSIDTPSQTFGGQGSAGRERDRALGPLSEHLECVPLRRRHDVEDALDELERHDLVEEVAHRVDEDHPRASPPQRLLETARREIDDVLCAYSGVHGFVVRPNRRLSVSA